MQNPGALFLFILRHVRLIIPARLICHGRRHFFAQQYESQYCAASKGENRINLFR